MNKGLERKIEVIYDLYDTMREYSVSRWSLLFPEFCSGLWVCLLVISLILLEGVWSGLDSRLSFFVTSFFARHFLSVRELVF